MAEFDIKCAEDVKKMIGWTIKDVNGASLNGDPYFLIRMSHPAAEKDIIFHIGAKTVIGRQGTMLSVESVLNFKVEDYKE